MKEIERKMSIDKGMIIKMNDNFYHGLDVLHNEALIGSDSGIFNKINRTYTANWLNKFV